MTQDPSNIINWWDSVTLALSDAWTRILTFLPNFIGAFVVLLIGLIVAGILKWVVVQILNAIQLESLAKRVKFTEILEKTGVKTDLNELLGNLVKWVIIIIFLLPALEVLGMPQVSDVLSQVLAYLPQAIVAGFLIFVGLIISDVVAHFVKGTAVAIGSANSSALASVARYAILVFVAIIALAQLGVATNFLLTLFTGIVAMIAIAGGLAFGLGGKDAAADLIKKLREDFSKK